MIGAGGEITIEPLTQIHGAIQSLGFRIGKFAYCTDVSDFPETTVKALKDLDVLIIDALQHNPHPSHMSLAEALDWIDRLKPNRAFLTHMHTPMDYLAVSRATPDNVMPAHDGMVVQLEAT